MKWERAASWLAAATASGTLLILDIFAFFPLRRPIPRDHWVTAVLFAVAFAVSVFMTRRGLAGAEPAIEDADKDVVIIGRSRFERLALAKRFLPRPLPAGWTKITATRKSVAWSFRAGDVLVRTWADETCYGAFVRVGMSRAGSDEPVETAQAAAILEHFGEIAHFLEVDTPPPTLKKEYPGMRCWCADAVDTVAALEKLPVPARGVARPSTPLRQLVRVLLPEKLPPGWSPPVGVTEIEDGWAMLVDDDLVMAMPANSSGTLRLMVFIVGDREDPVTVTGALDVLRHIRGVGDFRQVQGPEELPGGRSFIADIRGAEGITFEPKRKPELN